MTTKRDWIFRSDCMALRADHLEKHAQALMLEAGDYRRRAHITQEIANSMPEDKPIVIVPARS